jgi:FtsP/CotA-like multicopper oxidase with cupredoxin domain
VIRALLVGLAACTGAAAPFPEPPRLVDTNPDPAIVEVDLVAEPGQVELLPGKLADVWTFRDAAAARGTIPGPLLETNVGDRIVVHFANHLPDPTTVHWHGLRVPNAADGTPIAQLMVDPGATYDYAFTATDPGLYWYHPHMEADVQIERGLYAPILIHGPVEPAVAADRVLVLDDVKLEASGQLSTVTNELDIMLGRQGNVLLVNGAVRPQLEVATGARERWRFVNVANGRYFNLDLPGHRFLVIGWDGGPLPAPYETDTLLIAPGERYDVLVELAADTSLRTLHYDRGHDIPDPGPLELVPIHVGAPAAAPPPLPTAWGEVVPLPVDAATPVVQLVLAEQDPGNVEPTFSINGERYPDVTPTLGTRGALAIWELVNTAEMDHPFHLHGMEFQVLGAATLGWKDTVNVPQKQTLRFAVRYDADGRWMYHCHILEHAERGMMGELTVAP